MLKEPHTFNLPPLGNLNRWITLYNWHFPLESYLSLLKRLRSRPRSYLSVRACPVNELLASDFQSIFISYRSYSNIDQRTNDASFTLFCRNWMKVLLHVSFSNGLPYTWSNWILTLSSCPYIDWLICALAFSVTWRWDDYFLLQETSTLTHRCAEISTHFYLLF